ncbi:MAG: hypothetical protein AAGA83_00425 [Cyanobacteria bacterium P01_F01_bin.116]
MTTEKIVLSRLMIGIGFIAAPVILSYQSGDLGRMVEQVSITRAEQKQIDADQRDAKVKATNAIQASQLAIDRARTCHPVFGEVNGELVAMPLTEGTRLTDGATGGKLNPTDFVCNALGQTAEVDFDGTAFKVYKAADIYQDNGPFGEPANQTDLEIYMEIYQRQEAIYNDRKQTED